MSEVIHKMDPIPVPEDALQRAHKYARKRCDGASVAEMEIEARRDAIESGYDIHANPYDRGTFASLCFTDECQRNWNGERNGTDRKANG